MGEFVVFKNRLGVWTAYGYLTDKKPRIFYYDNIPFGISTNETVVVKSYSFKKCKALNKAANKLKRYSQKLHLP